MTDNLERFFNPLGIAILGASSDPGKLGYATARNIIESGFLRPVYFVNPKSGSLFDRPFYKSVMDVPDPVDLAILVVPAPAVPQAMRDVGQRSIPHAILTSGGFRETGEKGAALEEEVLKVCHEFNIRLIGPNCIGLMDMHLPLDATFLPPPSPKPGNIGFISHSGAFCGAIIDWSRQQGFGFSRIASLGNQADLTETEMLPAMAADPNTKSIALYLESIPNGRLFLETAGRVSKHTPVVAVKAGRTANGQKAALSHTGALAGTDSAVNAAFKKTGVVRALTVEELFDWSRAFASFPLPKGRNVAILTNAGGPGVIAADSLSDRTLNLATLSPETITALLKNLPPAGSSQNPVDMLASASPEDYANNLEILLADPQVDAVLVIIPPSPVYPTENIAQALVPILQKAAKPVIPILMGSELIQKAFQYFNNHDIPTFPFPERAASALSKLADRADFLDAREKVILALPEIDFVKIMTAISNLQEENQTMELGNALMDAIGIETASVLFARTSDEAEQLSLKIGFPLVAKIASPDILHKSDVGGVLLDLKSPESVREAFTTITDRAKGKRPQARLEGITLQRQIPAGQEVILGFIRDPQFGPLIMFGSGGIDVEGLKDTAFALAPLSPMEAETLIKQTWAGRKLAGYRSIPPADEAAVIDALIRLSWLAEKFPQITECEINPLKVLSKGAFAVDVRLKLA